MSKVPASPASDRNKQPILEQLLRLMPADALVLEIGSGWGQHAVFFCQAMPGLSWQPSDRREELPVLKQRLKQEGLKLGKRCASDPPGLRLPAGESSEKRSPVRLQQRAGRRT